MNEKQKFLPYQNNYLQISEQINKMVPFSMDIVLVSNIHICNLCRLKYKVCVYTYLNDSKVKIKQVPFT